jgi:hypothetical protein
MFLMGVTKHFHRGVMGIRERIVEENQNQDEHIESEARFARRHDEERRSDGCVLGYLTFSHIAGIPSHQSAHRDVSWTAVDFLWFMLLNG